MSLKKKAGLHGEIDKFGAFKALPGPIDFVGVDAYEAAGGIVMRDLFQDDNGGWLENVALLESLVTQKLKAEAETIAAEGWKWIEVAVEFPYGHAHGLRALEGSQP